MTRLDIATTVEKISLVEDQRTLVNQSIQIALDRVFQFYDWPYYLQEGAIETTDDYTTGTVSVTNGSKTVTGSSTTFTTAMAGRKFRVQNERPYYRIDTRDSDTQITLEQNYQGSTNSGLSYEIFKDEYRLLPDVDRYKLIRQLQNGIPLISLHPTTFDLIHATPQAYADPIYEIMSGTKLDIYSTGTISATIDTTTITGSSTSWTSVEGLGRMSKIRQGNNVYTVKSVDSDTSITTYENISPAISAGASYEITLNNLVVQLYHIPNAQRLLYYRYFRIPALLANNYDLPDMPHEFHWLLIYGALSFIYLHKGDINKAQIEAENRFIVGLNDMRRKIGSFTPDRVYGRKSTDRIRRIRIDGLEAANFDRKYSM